MFLSLAIVSSILLAIDAIASDDEETEPLTIVLLVLIGVTSFAVLLLVGYAFYKFIKPKCKTQGPNQKSKTTGLEQGDAKKRALNNQAQQKSKPAVQQPVQPKVKVSKPKLPYYVIPGKLAVGQKEWASDPAVPYVSLQNKQDEDPNARKTDAAAAQRTVISFIRNPFEAKTKGINDRADANAQKKSAKNAPRTDPTQRSGDPKPSSTTGKQSTKSGKQAPGTTAVRKPTPEDERRGMKNLAEAMKNQDVEALRQGRTPPTYNMDAIDKYQRSVKEAKNKGTMK